jgi:hypothetical protein
VQLAYFAFAIGLFATPGALLAQSDNSPLKPGFPPAQNSLTAPEQTFKGRPLKDAPVPELGPQGVAPAARAGGPGLQSDDAGPVDSTPFSSAGSGTLGGGSGQTDAHSRADDAGDRSFTTPNLSR